MMAIGLGVLVWVYVLIVLKRGNLLFFQFLWGSTGLLVLLMTLLQPYMAPFMTEAVSQMACRFGQWSGLYQANAFDDTLMLYAPDALLFLSVHDQSGVLELLAFSAMLWFFPFAKFWRKLSMQIFGALWLALASILRMALVCTLVALFGSGCLYWVQTILARMVFYVLILLLYYNCFTVCQIRAQKLGGIRYESALV